MTSHPLRLPLPTIDPSAPPEPITPAEVIQATLERWGIQRDELLSGSRRKRVTLARRACVCALRQALPSLSLADIGAELLIDHTSVLYALRKAGIAHVPACRAS